MKKEKSFYDKTLAAIVTHIADGALIVDKHGKVLEMNNALQRMTGWLPADVVGKQSCFALKEDYVFGGFVATASNVAEAAKLMRYNRIRLTAGDRSKPRPVTEPFLTETGKKLRGF